MEDRFSHQWISILLSIFCFHIYKQTHSFLVLSICRVYKIGSTGVNTSSNGSSRMTSNSISQQSNSTRQQTNNNQTAGSTLNGDTVTNLSDDKASINDDKTKQLTDMPLEIFERIFQYSGYKEVSNMRLVRDLK